MLTRYRRRNASLTRAALLSAHNDALANVAIIAARLLTAYTSSAFAGPDRCAGYRRHERGCNEDLAAPSPSNRRDVDGSDGGITRPWEAARSSQVGP
jgi:hypothetical protein